MVIVWKKGSLLEQKGERTYLLDTDTNVLKDETKT